MLAFARRFISELKNIEPGFKVICSVEVALYLQLSSAECIYTPSAISNTKAISIFRPILWVLYSFYMGIYLSIKYGRSSHLIALTHHPIFFYGGKQTVTVHDVRPYYFPDSFLQRLMFKYILPRKLRKIDYYITVSHSVKRQLVNLYSLEQSRIYVVSNVISAKEFDSDSIDYANKKRQFLSVGASWRHKNIHTFITNWKIWSDRYSLVIVCGKTEYFKFLSDLVEKCGLSDSVIFFHDVTFGRLKSLYSESLGLIYPSLDEGFGIPPVEALLCKCVPVVNDIPIFHEVLGDSALYVNPDSKDSWSDIIYFFDNFKNVLFDFSAGERYGSDRLNKELRQFLEVSK